jgi:hypothetical protein
VYIDEKCKNETASADAYLVHALHRGLYVGVCQRIDGWRPGIDEEGWMLRHAEMEASRDSDEDSDDEGPTSLGGGGGHNPRAR